MFSGKCESDVWGLVSQQPFFSCDLWPSLRLPVLFRWLSGTSQAALRWVEIWTNLNFLPAFFLFRHVWFFCSCGIMPGKPVRFHRWGLRPVRSPLEVAPLPAADWNPDRSGKTFPFGSWFCSGITTLLKTCRVGRRPWDVLDQIKASAGGSCSAPSKWNWTLVTCLFQIPGKPWKQSGLRIFLQMSTWAICSVFEQLSSCFCTENVILDKKLK